MQSPISSYGDFGKVAKVFDFPKGFEKHFEAALKILERE